MLGLFFCLPLEIRPFEIVLLGDATAPMVAGALPLVAMTGRTDGRRSAGRSRRLAHAHRRGARGQGRAGSARRLACGKQRASTRLRRCRAYGASGQRSCLLATKTCKRPSKPSRPRPAPPARLRAARRAGYAAVALAACLAFLFLPCPAALARCGLQHRHGRAAYHHAGGWQHRLARRRKCRCHALRRGPARGDVVVAGGPSSRSSRQRTGRSWWSQKT